MGQGSLDLDLDNINSKNPLDSISRIDPRKKIRTKFEQKKRPAKSLLYCQFYIYENILINFNVKKALKIRVSIVHIWHTSV